MFCRGIVVEIKDNSLAMRKKESHESDYIEFRGECFRKTKGYWHGTHRVCSPRETLEKIRPYFKTVGLTRLANITGLDRIGLPTVISVRPNAAYLSVDAGKGFTLEAATASAAMECIERYHAEIVRVPEIEVPYDQLGGSYHVIPVGNLPLSKNSLFNAGRPERWTPGWDIANQCDVAVPTLMVTMECHRCKQSELISFQIGSNGLASGNHFLEALSSGLHEVVERDAVACHRVAEERLGCTIPRVRLETIEHPLVIEQLERLKAAQVQAVLFDCTLDTEVPTYMCYIYDLVSRNVGIYRGYGAHLDPEIAIVRAIAEAAQARLVYISGSRDDFFRYRYNRLKSGDNMTVIRRLEDVPATVDARQRKSQSTSTFEGDILAILKKLKRVGLYQVIVLDLTLPGFSVSVVRVIVPGLEGYMFDYYSPGHRALEFVRSKQETLRKGGQKDESCHFLGTIPTSVSSEKYTS